MGQFCKNKIRCFPFIILQTIFHRAFIFHMLFGLVEDMTTIDFRYTRSKAKVTRVLFVKQWFAHYLEKIFITKLLNSTCWLILVMPWPFWFWIQRPRSQGSLKNMYTCFLINILRTIYHIAFIFHMLIGLDRDMTHIDIEVIRSKVKVRRITFVK